jgi:hypothetical protein
VTAQKWWWEDQPHKPFSWEHAGRLAWCFLNCARIMKGLPAVELPQAPPPAPPTLEIPLTPAKAASLLGVTVDASADEARAALRAKMSAGGVHPDHGGDERAAKELIAAKNLLVERARSRS